MAQVVGTTTDASPAVSGTNSGAGSSGRGVFGQSTNGDGVYGTTAAPTKSAVAGINTGGGYGVYGSASGSGTGTFGGSASGIGIQGTSTSSNGVQGTTSGAASGVYGEGGNVSGFGLAGRNTTTTGTGAGAGVFGESYNANLPGVKGTSAGAGLGVYGSSAQSTGIRGDSASTSLFTAGVYGWASSTSASSAAAGVWGGAAGGTSTGVVGYASGTGAGVWGYSAGGEAGHFAGSVYVSGYLTKAGGGFLIDHPLEPTSRDLLHSFVESPDMKNVYDGVGAANDAGELVVTMPPYVEALHGTFRYQLTAIGAPAPNLHVKSELSGGQFVAAGASPGQRICWQLTGVRKDPWALAEMREVEPQKPARMQGRYRHPEAYGQPGSAGIEPTPPAESES
ncbi:MAG: hypothetical protein U0235_10255 [Polyangiaceae bacterium]